MKLRRTMALAAATAVIAPVVILSAPAAFATDPSSGTASPSVSPSVSPSETGSSSPSSAATPSPSTTESATTTPENTASATATAAATASETASPSPTPSATDAEEPDGEAPQACEPRPLELSLKGLSGKIVRGSGWHTFTFNAYNDSKTTVKNVAFYAGAAADRDGERLFSTKQVQLQALNEDGDTWASLAEQGTASGIVGVTDEIEPGYEVDITLRIKVKASAPVGAGFNIGGGLVFGEDPAPCYTDVAYEFQIVKAGDEDGTKPQEGGKVPVPAEKPAAADTNQVTGSLAETGSSSSTPVFALAGGAAVVLGAGAMFVVRRRKNGDAAA